MGAVTLSLLPFSLLPVHSQVTWGWGCLGFNTQATFRPGGYEGPSFNYLAKHHVPAPSRRDPRTPPLVRLGTEEQDTWAKVGTNTTLGSCRASFVTLTHTLTRIFVGYRAYCEFQTAHSMPLPPCPHRQRAHHATARVLVHAPGRGTGFTPSAEKFWHSGVEKFALQLPVCAARPAAPGLHHYFPQRLPDRLSLPSPILSLRNGRVERGGT